jgi:hypothetical protein
MNQLNRLDKDLLDEDEIDRGLVDEFYSKRGLEWKDWHANYDVYLCDYENIDIINYIDKL